MNKKRIAAGAVCIGAIAGTALHGYMDVMGRERKFKSIIVH